MRHETVCRNQNNRYTTESILKNDYEVALSEFDGPYRLSHPSYIQLQPNRVRFLSKLDFCSRFDRFHARLMLLGTMKLYILETSDKMYLNPQKLPRISHQTKNDLKETTLSETDRCLFILIYIFVCIMNIYLNLYRKDFFLYI